MTGLRRLTGLTGALREQAKIRAHLSQVDVNSRQPGDAIAAATAAAPAFLLAALTVSIALCRRVPDPPVADHAVLELTLRELRGHPLLLGAYSRFGWYHPGPLWLYSLAPFLALLSHNPFALNVGAGIINLLATSHLMRRVGDKWRTPTSGWPEQLH